MDITEEQMAKFHKLWFVYGNNGKKSTLFNHKLIQGFVEYNEDRREDYANVNKNLEEKFGKIYADKNGITQECLDAIKELLENK